MIELDLPFFLVPRDRRAIELDLAFLVGEYGGLID